MSQTTTQDWAARGVVLIVDDEIDLREAVAFDFERKGYQVLTAANGEEAYQIATRDNVDVILTDVRMPGGDGIELLRRLKDRDGWSPAVFLMTGYTDMGIDE